jgi:hypothetical protein
MFSFIKKFTDYSPKSFKGKSVKEILAMKSANVPVDFFTDAYTQAYAKEFENADLSEEQENAIDLLSDLKDKREIIRKCYDKRQKRAQGQQAQKAPMEQAQGQQAQKAPMEQAQAQDQQVPTQEQMEEETDSEDDEQVVPQGPIQAPAEGNATPQNERPLIGGGKRKHSKHKRSKHKRSKHTKKHAGGGKHKRSKHKRSKHKRSKHTKKHAGGGKPSKKSKRVRFAL